MTTEVKSELQTVEKEQKRLPGDMAEWSESADKYLTFADRVCARFNKACNDEKRDAEYVRFDT